MPEIAKTMRKKTWIARVAAVVALCIGGLFLSQPFLIQAILAKYKSTAHFIVLAEDPRIRYEGPAKENAIALKDILSKSQKQVEFVLKANFRKPVELYVCASQNAFNDHVFLSKNVKGAVYWGKVFLSPGAFGADSDALAEVTTHELTHYLFYTYLGEKAHLVNVPLWFREGVATFVADGGADYTRGRDVADRMSIAEKEAYLAGDTNFWFASKDPRDALNKKGTANWLLYRVGASFVHYLHDSQPDRFDKLIKLLLSGTDFSDAVAVSYGRNIGGLRNEFSQYLLAKGHP